MHPGDFLRIRINISHKIKEIFAHITRNSNPPECTDKSFICGAINIGLFELQVSRTMSEICGYFWRKAFMPVRADQNPVLFSKIEKKSTSLNKPRLSIVNLPKLYKS